MSSRDMTINEIKAVDKDFGAKHTISVKGFKDGGRVTTTEVSNTTIKMINDLAIEMRNTIADVLVDMRKGFAQVNSRIDKLENLVITEFKKHKWI